MYGILSSLEEGQDEKILAGGGTGLQWSAAHQLLGDVMVHSTRLQHDILNSNVSNWERRYARSCGGSEPCILHLR